MVYPSVSLKTDVATTLCFSDTVLGFVYLCRARLQALHHACARHHEALGDIKAAVQQYAASGTAATEVRVASQPSMTSGKHSIYVGCACTGPVSTVDCITDTIIAMMALALLPQPTLKKWTQQFAVMQAASICFTTTIHQPGHGARVQVARMLWQAEDMSALERQVAVSDDVDLLTWWARACEASNNYAHAISCYQRAGGARCAQPCGMGRSGQGLFATLQSSY
jgi:hypothetical protein